MCSGHGYSSEGTKVDFAQASKRLGRVETARAQGFCARAAVPLGSVCASQKIGVQRAPSERRRFGACRGRPRREGAEGEPGAGPHHLLSDGCQLAEASPLGSERLSRTVLPSRSILSDSVSCICMMSFTVASFPLRKCVIAWKKVLNSM